MIDNLELRRSELTQGRRPGDIGPEPNGHRPHQEFDIEAEGVNEHPLRPRGNVRTGSNQHIRAPSNDRQSHSLVEMSRGGRGGHVQFFANGSIQVDPRGTMQVLLPGRPSTPNSPRPGPASPRLAGSPMDIASPRSESPAFFNFDRPASQSPELTRGSGFGGPLALDRMPAQQNRSRGSGTRPRARSRLGPNFETESGEEDYIPPGERRSSSSGGMKRDAKRG